MYKHITNTPDDLRECEISFSMLLVLMLLLVILVWLVESGLQFPRYPPSVIFAQCKRPGVLLFEKLSTRDTIDPEEDESWQKGGLERDTPPPRLCMVYICTFCTKNATFDSLLQAVLIPTPNSIDYVLSLRIYRHIYRYTTDRGAAGKLIIPEKKITS